MQEVAAWLGLTPEALIAIIIEELLTRPDKTFQQTVSYVLKKNTWLYQQLVAQSDGSEGVHDLRG